MEYLSITHMLLTTEECNARISEFRNDMFYDLFFYAITATVIFAVFIIIHSLCRSESRLDRLEERLRWSQPCHASQVC